MRVDNKTELFSFLSKFLTENTHNTAKQILATDGANVMSATPVPGDSLIIPCAHEEEDVRMLLHVCHAAKQGVTKAMIRTVNTDVPVIAIGKCESLGLNELWMAYHQPQKMLSHSCLCLNVSSFCCMTERVKRIV